MTADWSGYSFTHGDPALPQYANGVAVTASQWDIELTFQHNRGPTGSETPGELAGTPIAKLVVSPQQAKALGFVLNGIIEQWEAKFGALPDVDALLGADILAKIESSVVKKHTVAKEKGGES